MRLNTEVVLVGQLDSRAGWLYSKARLLGCLGNQEENTKKLNKNLTVVLGKAQKGESLLELQELEISF